MPPRPAAILAGVVSLALGALVFLAVRAAWFSGTDAPTLALEYHAGPGKPALRAAFSNATAAPLFLPAAWRVLSVPPGADGGPHHILLLPRGDAVSTLAPGESLSSGDLLPRLPAQADISVRAVAEIPTGRVFSPPLTARRER